MIRDNFDKVNWKLFWVLMLFLMTTLVTYAFLNAPKDVILFGDTYKSNIKELDLSKKKKIVVEDLEDKINEFPRLKKIVFKDYSITKNQRDFLNKTHPFINIDGYVMLNVYGKEIPENTKTLDFSDVTIDDKIEKKLKLFPLLKTVDFGENEFEVDEQFKLMEKYPNLKFKWLVNFAGNKVPSDQSEIILEKTNVEDIEEFKKTIPMFKKLSYLQMGLSNLSNDTLAELREEYKNDFKLAWTIPMGRWFIHTDDIAFSVLIVRYDYRRMTSEDIQVLKYCNELQALDLGHQNITDISVIGEYLTDLRILILADNRISDITPLKNLKHLHYLELFINPLHDYSPLEELKELVDLNICYNYVNDSSFITKLPKLERLWIVGTGIYGENLQKAIQQHPNLRYDLRGPGSTENGWRGHKRYFTMIDMFYKRDYISEEFTRYG